MHALLLPPRVDWDHPWVDHHHHPHDQVVLLQDGVRYQGNEVEGLVFVSVQFNDRHQQIGPRKHGTENRRKEGNVLFNDALNTFYLRLYGVRHMVKDHCDSEKGNPLPPHRLLFLINSKGSFICTIPQTG